MLVLPDDDCLCYNRNVVLYYVIYFLRKFTEGTKEGGSDALNPDATRRFRPRPKQKERGAEKGGGGGDSGMAGMDASVDQAHLPRVEEVKKEFSVLEDGVLAHHLQKQEIEDHYASNVVKSRLAAGDVRLARQLQEAEAQRQRLNRLTIEERDAHVAMELQQQEERAREEERRERERQDARVARRLQEGERRGRHVDSAAHPSPVRDQVGFVEEGMTEEIELDDAELARRLQQQEEQRAWKAHRAADAGLRAAVLAQDEEIAKFIQEKELKSLKQKEKTSVRAREKGEMEKERRRDPRKESEWVREREAGRERQEWEREREVRARERHGDPCKEIEWQREREARKEIDTGERREQERLRDRHRDLSKGSDHERHVEARGYREGGREMHGERTPGRERREPVSVRTADERSNGDSQRRPPRPPPPKNIAEELDPTFDKRPMKRPPRPAAPPSHDRTQGHPIGSPPAHTASDEHHVNRSWSRDDIHGSQPVEPEGAAAWDTRDQGQRWERAGRVLTGEGEDQSRSKKENCKQQ
uniref:Trichohyalin-like isoform X1 n=1 Tax=Petromyzon marinus TaxID=7757 RepID=A0AAJ7TJ99_PETMA|nr:trichohyalin-like isoform X1 [Petromyzon marinus]